MTETLRIKEADDGDRTFIVNGLIQLQNHEAALHDTRKTGDHKLCESYFEEILTNSHNGNGALLVAYMNNLPVGFICFWVENNSSLVETEDSNRCGYISDVFVVKEYRGKRVARHMIDEVQSRLMKNPLIKRLRICSLSANLLAVSAYEGAGFQPYEIIYEKILR